jgi:hypothetical protein
MRLLRRLGNLPHVERNVAAVVPGAQPVAAEPPFPHMLCRDFSRLRVMSESRQEVICEDVRRAFKTKGPVRYVSVRPVLRQIAALKVGADHLPDFIRNG